MPPKIITTECWLEVYPRTSIYGIRVNDDIADQKKILKELESQIKRHCDEVGSIVLKEVRESVCEFCGGAWTEEDPGYNGGCCAKDEEGSPDAPVDPSFKDGGQFGMGA